MINDNIRALAVRDDGANLDRLEADIWKAEAVARQSQHDGRTLASLQAGVLVFAIATSALAGIATAANAAHKTPASLLNPGNALAPSHLLFGNLP